MQMRKTVLGVKIDFLKRIEALETISEMIFGKQTGGAKHIVTAYSEFFVVATKDLDFKKVLARAELVVPDGIGPLAAVDYLESVNAKDSILLRLFKGAVTGVKILFGKVGEPISGIWLFCRLVEVAANGGWKVYLLGGFGDVSYKLAAQLKEKYPKLIIAADPGDQRLEEVGSGSDDVIDKINRFQPDILFVAYGPVKQEKWIDKNKRNLNTKVAMGVGGTFDELTGKVKPAPVFIEKMGLKWLWRLIQEPKRFRRILNAYPIFPLMVFGEILSRDK